MEKLIKFLKKEYIERSKKLQLCAFCGKQGKFSIVESSYQHGIDYELWLICENTACIIKFGKYLISSYVFVNDYKRKIDREEFINDIEELIKKWNELSKLKNIIVLKNKIQRETEKLRRELTLTLFELTQNKD